MHTGQIFAGFIFGIILLIIGYAIDSKFFKFTAMLVTTVFILDGLGVSRNVGLLTLAVISVGIFILSLLFKSSAKNRDIHDSFVSNLKMRIEAREALTAKEVAQPTPASAPVPAIVEVINVAELTEEERIESLEKEATLAEREAAALLRKRAAGRKLEKAFHEDVIEAARQQRTLEKTVNPPAPPLLMTPEQKLNAIFELEAAKKADKLKLINEGHKEGDSDALDLINSIYEKKLKALNALPTSK